MKLGQLIDIAMGKILRKNFVLLEGLDPNTRSFLIYQNTAVNQNLILIGRWTKGFLH